MIYDFSSFEVASVIDSSRSTGVTFFNFPGGAKAAYDARGGSVASAETSLLDIGSYSNIIDGILFAGGSTLGLEASAGIRESIFNNRTKEKPMSFDAVPSIPGAVVYDFSYRNHKGSNRTIYPNMDLGREAFKKAKPNFFEQGRFGAGVCTTANKISNPIWGGQGAAFEEWSMPQLNPIKIFCAVVLNPRGNVILESGEIAEFDSVNSPQKNDDSRGNTTLSIVITDLKLDRNSLQRLATSVHANMCRYISPFQTSTDGDILFAVSTDEKKLDCSFSEIEIGLINQVNSLMKAAIHRSVDAANT